MRDNGQPLAKLRGVYSLVTMSRSKAAYRVQTDGLKVDAVNLDETSTNLYHAEERLRHTGLSGTCPTNDTDLFACPDIERHAPKHEREFRTVSQLDIFERHSSGCWPRAWWRVCREHWGRFVLELAIMLHPFDVVLQRSQYDPAVNLGP